MHGDDIWGAALGDVTALILAGGLGTRIRSVLGETPKALAPVGGRPFLAYLLDQLADAGISRVVLATGYRGEALRRTFGDSYGPLSLSYSQETSQLGTAGAIRHAMPSARSHPVLVMNGDSWCDLDLLTFLSWHRARRAEASIWLTQPESSAPPRYARVATDHRGRVLRFDEKQASDWINAGVYFLSRTFAESIPKDRSVSLEREIFPEWIGRGLYACAGNGRFLDIGTPDSFRGAASFFAASSAQRSEPSRRRYVLLDRDGTINIEKGYLSKPEDLELIPGAAEALERLRAIGTGLVVITNQSGVGRGYFSADSLSAIHDRLHVLLRDHGVELDGLYCCPHAPGDNCECRKPRPGLATEAARALNFRLDESFFVGDTACDIETGSRIGARTILVRTGYGEETLRNRGVQPDFAVENLAEAAHLIEYLSRSGTPLVTGKQFC